MRWFGLVWARHDIEGGRCGVTSPPNHLASLGRNGGAERLVSSEAPRHRHRHRHRHPWFGNTHGNNMAFRHMGESKEYILRSNSRNEFEEIYWKEVVCRTVYGSILNNIQPIYPPSRCITSSHVQPNLISKSITREIPPERIVPRSSLL